MSDAESNCFKILGHISQRPHDSSRQDIHAFLFKNRPLFLSRYNSDTIKRSDVKHVIL